VDGRCNCGINSWEMWNKIVDGKSGGGVRFEMLFFFFLPFSEL